MNDLITSSRESAGVSDTYVQSKTIEEILRHHDGHRGGLIAILEEVQRVCGHLPETALRLVAQRTGYSLRDVFGVATFYKSFSLKPRGKHLIAVCLGTACHVRGGQSVAEEFGRQLGIKAGETTADGEFTLETVNCLGACALGPIAVVGGRYYPKMETGFVADILAKARNNPRDTAVTSATAVSQRH